ncbi:prolyl oligopeptidase family serine peptidase [Rhizobium calliandrae]|uniref:Prolyl oligopeptidase family serine peptidase n=1 Tax=Rhizobium calliandrae TaxID=1312182 RepID=A0ABT7KI33_9HYPH|nr:alpha/beta fold hydrolase [Rhizobium calliandrae]MDL2408298.1 prolyl oligopeptidase family serine peptidase [Rhizobium calliandrae]
MKLLMKISLMLCAIAIMQQSASASGDVGVRQVAVPSKERGSDLAVTVWYPADSGGKPVSLGESLFFVGTPAMLDAPIAYGKFPLVLLSHGAGLAGNAQALSWIAMPLAKQGFVVAAPTHPGNTGANRSAAETMKLWLRPADITETLNATRKNAAFREHLELNKVGILGLSMGGSTALAIAGARIDSKRLASYCDTDALNSSLCEWVRQSGVDLHAMDLTLAGRDNEDARVRFAMAIDPGPVDVFEFSTFSRISIPVVLVNLGQPGKIPLTVQAAKIAEAIPHATYSTIEDASHFSMFPECKPGAAEIAESEDLGDPICSDGRGRSRNEIHAQLIDMVVTAFSRALKTSP